MLLVPKVDKARQLLGVCFMPFPFPSFFKYLLRRKDVKDTTLKSFNMELEVTL